MLGAGLCSASLFQIMTVLAYITGFITTLDWSFKTVVVNSGVTNTRWKKRSRNGDFCYLSWKQTNKKK